MNKTELVDAIATATNLTKVDVTAVLDAFIETSKKQLKKGEEINLVGFLSLKKVQRAARAGRNPQTGKEIKIAAKNVVKAKVGKTLQDAVK
jgi:DNA-binding protein HU-beta